MTRWPMAAARSREAGLFARMIGPGNTAKTARTRSGSYAAFRGSVSAGAQPTFKAIVEAAVRRLHKSPAIVQRSDIHPQSSAISRGEVSPEVAQKKLPKGGLRKTVAALPRIMQALPAP